VLETLELSCVHDIRMENKKLSMNIYLTEDADVRNLFQISNAKVSF
jgi:hypothetical protein